jgi:hypothetical protein
MGPHVPCARQCDEFLAPEREASIASSSAASRSGGGGVFLSLSFGSTFAPAASATTAAKSP